MENDLPKIDIPVNWIIGTDISKEILSMYTNFPCRLKAEIFVLCMQGHIEASINLTRFEVKPFDFITILPGSIMQIHKVEGDLRIYFMGFSSDFIKQANIGKPSIDVLYSIRENPLISLKEKGAYLMEEYFSLLIRTYGHCSDQMNKEIITHFLHGTLLGLGILYKDQPSGKISMQKSEQISKNFRQMVMQNYMRERNVSFYAKKLGITPAHLCTTVKQTTGKTCIEIISAMVIMDAKAQLKSTDLSIHDIAYSLNFTNMSFFGKYFKRHVGMGPAEYRNS